MSPAPPSSRTGKSGAISMIHPSSSEARQLVIERVEPSEFVVVHGQKIMAVARRRVAADFLRGRETGGLEQLESGGLGSRVALNFDERAVVITQDHGLLFAVLHVHRAVAEGEAGETDRLRRLLIAEIAITIVLAALDRQIRRE